MSSQRSSRAVSAPRRLPLERVRVLQSFAIMRLYVGLPPSRAGGPVVGTRAGVALLLCRSPFGFVLTFSRRQSGSGTSEMGLGMVPALQFTGPRDSAQRGWVVDGHFAETRRP